MENQIILLFQIKPSSGIPIYKQIIDQVNRLVASGHLRPGDELPSIRQVASVFAVNPMTVSKAYSLLEATGVLERLRGKGMIVASNQAATRNHRKRLGLMEPILREAAAQASQLGLPKETILQAFAEYLEESKEQNQVKVIASLFNSFRIQRRR
jgi:GntR family transcriptional regulator